MNDRSNVISQKPLEEPRPAIQAVPVQQGQVPAGVRVNSFDVPASARMSPHDPKRVSLRELDPDQQLEAASIARGERTRMTFELAKMSLYAVDGRVLNHGEFEAETLWRRWSSKMRGLIYVAYGKMHNSDDSEDAAFLASMKPGV